MVLPAGDPELEITACGETLGCSTLGRISLEDLGPGVGREITLDWNGLLSPHIRDHYEEAGLMKFSGGKKASQLTVDDPLDELS